MIVAVCLNAALDVTYEVPALVPGESHRASAVHERAGGKGINVARVAHQLGAPVRVLALAGGGAGARITAELCDAGIEHIAVPTRGESRRCVTVVAGSQATVVNEPGPVVGPGEWAELLDAAERGWAAGDVVVLSGSLPPGVPKDAYAQLIGLAGRLGARSVLDADGAALAAALPARPDVVAPNRAEAAALFGDAAPVEGARRLRAAGAGAAVVSCGPDGLVAATADGVERAIGPRQVDGNPTGAGDALTAALAHGIASGSGWHDILRDAVATSAAAVAVPHAGEIDVQVFAELRPGVRIEPLVEVG